MKKYLFICLSFFAVFSLGDVACKKELDVGNPNAPTLSGNVNSEAGLISLSQGSIYINGFNHDYFLNPWAYIELMADVLGTQLGGPISSMGVPDVWIINDSIIHNTYPSIQLLRKNNTRASTAAGTNAFHYQWSDMYALNNACNTILSLIDGIKMSGDSAAKKNTFRAWCYWWKGYAYASIGSMYYSGLIIDQSGIKSNNFVLHDEIVQQSNLFLNMASASISVITNVSAYSNIMEQLIPDFCQDGKGFIPTREMWVRNINTMLARNILVNKLSPFVHDDLNSTITKSSTSIITTADWNIIFTLASNGINANDHIFTGRSPETNAFFYANEGTVATATLTANTNSTYKISERFIQNYKAGDKRLSNNFDTTTTFNGDQTFTTRYSMIDGGLGIPDVYVYGSLKPNDYELIIAGSYEENELILAEANIRLGNIEAGLAQIDAVRDYQHAGIAHIAGTGLNPTQAMKELTMERRVALVFRGLSFYDSRRWGWIYSIENGGGTFNNTLITVGGTINYNVTFNNNFLDYWDVPADETDLNPPSANSAPVINPNFH